MLQLFTVFHLNLAYSSIEEEQRPEVIERCYWPLLRLAERLDLPLGIEASGYTLETVASIDPAWIDALRRLTRDGRCEFVGSGYAQLIGPLVPAEVNAANLRLGHETYERLLGFRPDVALVNEQAYAAGLIQHYLDAGYRAIVMEWDNPFRGRRDWAPEWRYLPQRAVGQQGEEMPIIWNKSIAFQKFQRYAHAEEELDEYVAYLTTHQASEPRGFSLYGNDVEIFDFRPGRYQTEPSLATESEWGRIARLFETLQADAAFQMVRPRDILALMSQPGAGHALRLESPEQPVPVKKQGKYNITRWAVTGRDDVGVNTACWRIYEALTREAHPGSVRLQADPEAEHPRGVRLRADSGAAEADWRELCYLWSSDFRTHITDTRWEAYRARLAAFGRRCEPCAEWRNDLETTRRSHNTAGDVTRLAGLKLQFARSGRSHESAHGSRPVTSRDGHYLTVETDTLRLRLNCRRGLAIDSLLFKDVSPVPLCGTLEQGYYDDITLGADYYTGHVVFEGPGRPKITDLNRADPIERFDEPRDELEIETRIDTPLGPVVKIYRVNGRDPNVSLSYRLEWPELPLGSLRLGHITLKPDAFDQDTLYYGTANGGRHPDTFAVGAATIDHGDAVSFLVSATHAVGITNGVVELGDANRRVRVEVDKTASALVGMVTYYPVGRTYFCRVALSAGEVDETRHAVTRPPDDYLRCELILSARAR